MIKDLFMAKEKILVVDDEEDLLELIKFNLFRKGYKVVCTPSGEEALRTAKSKIRNAFFIPG